jgi:hypothetical protein
VRGAGANRPTSAARPALLTMQKLPATKSPRRGHAQGGAPRFAAKEAPERHAVGAPVLQRRPASGAVLQRTASSNRTWASRYHPSGVGGLQASALRIAIGRAAVGRFSGAGPRPYGGVRGPDPKVSSVAGVSLARLGPATDRRCPRHQRARTDRFGTPCSDCSEGPGFRAAAWQQVGDLGQVILLMRRELSSRPLDAAHRATIMSIEPEDLISVGLQEVLDPRAPMRQRVPLANPVKIPLASDPAKDHLRRQAIIEPLGVNVSNSKIEMIGHREPARKVTLDQAQSTKNTIESSYSLRHRLSGSRPEAIFDDHLIVRADRQHFHFRPHAG